MFSTRFYGGGTAEYSIIFQIRQNYANFAFVVHNDILKQLDEEEHIIGIRNGMPDKEDFLEYVLSNSLCVGRHEFINKVYQPICLYAYSDEYAVSKKIDKMTKEILDIVDKEIFVEQDSLIKYLIHISYFGSHSIDLLSLDGVSQEILDEAEKYDHFISMIGDTFGILTKEKDFNFKRIRTRAYKVHHYGKDAVR